MAVDVLPAALQDHSLICVSATVRIPMFIDPDEYTPDQVREVSHLLGSLAASGDAKCSHDSDSFTSLLQEIAEYLREQAKSM